MTLGRVRETAIPKQRQRRFELGTRAVISTLPQCRASTQTALPAALGLLQCSRRLRVESMGRERGGPRRFSSISSQASGRARPRAPGVSRYSFPVSSFRLICEADGVRTREPPRAWFVQCNGHLPRISNGALLCTIGYLVT